MLRRSCRNRRKPSPRVYVGLLAFAVLCSINQSAWVSIAAELSSSTAVVQPAYVAVDGPVTLAATTTFPETWDPDSAGAADIPLFTLYTDSNGGKAGLSFVWARKTAGWLPLWELQMRDHAGVHPVPLAPAEQDVAHGESQEIGLTLAMPTAGDTYELAVALNPRTGNLSLRFLDCTDGQVVYAGYFRTDLSEVTLYAPSESATGKDQSASGIVQSVKTVEQGFVPVGATWTVGKMDGNHFLRVRLFSPGDQVYAQLFVPGEDLDGELRLTLKQSDQQNQIVIKPNSTTPTLQQLPQVAPGRSMVALEYVRDHGVVWSDSSTIQVGSSSLHLDSMQVDQVEKLITTSLYAIGDELPSLPITVRATFSELVWNDQQRAYKEQAVVESKLFDGVIASAASVADKLQVSLPMPRDPGFYRAAISATASTDDYAVQTDSVKKYVAVQAPADPTPDRPYTVVVLPDSQHYARLYPTIAIRQSEWIANNARERNIALVLHMGDVTHNNNKAQWENAYESMSLLDGIVPYVIALGNHDFLVGASNVNRNATLFNSYFRADNFPLLAGVFEPGKLNNSYHLADIAGNQYLVLSLEFAPRNEVLDWANQVVASHPNHRVIMITHTYTNQAGEHKVIEPADRKFSESMNDGTEMWSKLVSQHPNMMMVFSGHLGVATVPRAISTGSAGNPVFEMLTDYQNEANGGNGWMLLVEFYPDQTVRVQAFSPYLNAFKTHTDKYGFDNDFVIDLVNGEYRRP